jgi:hypothetical protein
MKSACVRHARAHTHRHSHKCSLSPAHTLELRCRWVWGLTLSPSSPQQALSWPKHADGASFWRILKPYFAQVACVFERERECVCHVDINFPFWENMGVFVLHIYTCVCMWRHVCVLIYLNGYDTCTIVRTEYQVYKYSVYMEKCMCKCTCAVYLSMIFDNNYMILCIVSVCRVLELVKGLLRMHSSLWIYTQSIRNQVSTQTDMFDRNAKSTITLSQTNTPAYTRTHPRAAMPTSVRPDSLSLLLSATFILITTS